MADLKELIKRASGTWGKSDIKTFDATVISVDMDNRTCVVNSLDYSVQGLEVRFMPEVSDGDMNLPQIQSTVIVCMTDFTDPYIVNTTWLDQKTIIVGDTEITLVDGNVTISQGSLSILIQNGKISITNSDTNESLFAILKSLVKNIENALYVNGAGQASLSPTSLPNFEQNITDLTNLLF